MMFMSVELLLALLGKAALFFSGIEKGSLFPKPLGPEQEEEYIRRKLQGDKEAAEKLVEHNLRLVAHIAKKYRGQNRDMDDLVSIGTIGLIKAVNTYRPDKGVQLATYAARCVENEILMSIRSDRKKRNEVYMDEPIGTDSEGNEISLGDILGSGTDEITDTVDLHIETDRLRKLIEQLPPQQKKVITLRYGIGNQPRLTQKEIGELLGISRSYVSRIEKKAIETLNRKFSLTGQ